jgi:hypothetical protein
VKLANFEPILVLWAEKFTTFEPKGAKSYISHGYIFRILQHFATKFGNFTNLRMFFKL